MSSIKDVRRLAREGDLRGMRRVAQSLEGRGHDFARHATDCGDADHSGRCPWDDGDLASCRTCGLAEGQLTVHCPGEDARIRGEDTYAGRLDYVSGEWVEVGDRRSRS